MKKLLKSCILMIALIGIVGCERGLSVREKECYELTQDPSCIGKAYSQRRSHDFGPVSPGEYQNHYGNPQHGSWDSQGRYNFHNPTGPFASSTNAFLLGAGAGGLAAYMLTKKSNRSSWNSSNPNGYTKKVHSQKTYLSKSGKTISKTEFYKRKAQSDKAKASNKAKAKKAKQVKALKKQKAIATERKRAADKKSFKPTNKKPMNFAKKRPAPKAKPRRKSSGKGRR